jgi:hypothetical protein
MNVLQDSILERARNPKDGKLIDHERRKTHYKNKERQRLKALDESMSATVSNISVKSCGASVGLIHLSRPILQHSPSHRECGYKIC